MKRTFTLLAAALATTAAAQKPYHRDLAVLEVNREAPRTEFVEFASRDEALTRSFERSDAYRSLDGVWKFRYADDVRALPADATAADADTSAWSDIRVPGNWELQGHGTPIYVNTRYEYATIDPAPPHLPEAIPAGVYRRTFTVPEAWAGRRVYLTIGGAKSGVYVYVNGREAGYNEDSKNPAQYRIDPLLRPGENTLALKMTRGAPVPTSKRRTSGASAASSARSTSRPKRPTRCAISRSYRRSTTATARGFSR